MAWQPTQPSYPESAATAYTASQLAVLPRVPEPETAVPDPETNSLLNLTTTQLPPDDYLESSEELLRGLAAEEAEARVERGFMHSLLTPLGLGSMLLLLLSSATFGYVLMNPSVLRPLGWGRSPNAASSTTPANSTGVAPTNAEAVGLPNSPNLASKEFVDLNLGTLSTLKANSGAGKTTATPGKSVAVPKVTAVPSTSGGAKGARSTTTAPATSGDVPGAAAPYVVQPVSPPLSIAPPPPPAAIYNQPAVEQPIERYAPEPAAPRAARVEPAPIPIAPEPVAPQPRVAEPEPASSATAAKPTGNSAYDYKVVTEYNGDATLDQAQKAIPDAYVRNFPDGARIQLGAFDEAGKAEELVEKLEKQGIPAKVEQH